MFFERKLARFFKLSCKPVFWLVVSQFSGGCKPPGEVASICPLEYIPLGLRAWPPLKLKNGYRYTYIHVYIYTYTHPLEYIRWRPLCHRPDLDLYFNHTLEYIPFGLGVAPLKVSAAAMQNLTATCLIWNCLCYKQKQLLCPQILIWC